MMELRVFGTYLTIVRREKEGVVRIVLVAVIVGGGQGQT
jgi:hypothetical protein